MKESDLESDITTIEEENIVSGNTIVNNTGGNVIVSNTSNTSNTNSNVNISQVRLQSANNNKWEENIKDANEFVEIDLTSIPDQSEKSTESTSVCK